MKIDNLETNFNETYKATEETFSEIEGKQKKIRQKLKFNEDKMIKTSSNLSHSKMCSLDESVNNLAELVAGI